MGSGPPLWAWLGEPLPLDVANTVRRVGSRYTELWREGADVADWAGHQAARVPPVSAADAASRLDELRALRDDVFAVLRAAAGGEPYPAGAAGRLNARARSRPVVDQLGARAGELHGHVAAPGGPVDELAARIVHATIAFTAGPDIGRLALCDAPGCGQFFLRARRDQRWCGGSCGTRARVARHAAHATRAARTSGPPPARPR